ncbi:MAG TPA: DNA/RNA helicase [Erysipelotrichaceae bacterium]|nr:DNA/RNA helicase [Erysipelotrichaceae bacterium]
MKCLRCHNEKESLFAYDQGVYYCRRCVAFGRMDVGQTLAIPDLSCRAVDVSPELKFALTKEQEHVSEQALAHLKNGKNVFVYAATGAGKTEICYRSICHYLKKGKKVGFAISRRQVVLEIAARLREVFPTLKIVEVCQDYTKEIDGDLIVCTIHQLYRYPETFDLLILDELDAFPYAGNALLKQFVDNACKGERLCLSATLDPSLQEDIDQKKVEVVALFQRPHKKPLIVPEVIRIFRLAQRLLVWHYCLQFTKQGKQTIVFVPRKKDTLFFELLLHPFNAKAIHSSKKNKDEIMEQFRNRQFPVLVSTTLLERGITVPGVQAIVYDGDHTVFTQASLIQIFGRVGRKFDDPYGRGICLCSRKNESIASCVRTIEWMNAHAASVWK